MKKLMTGTLIGASLLFATPGAYAEPSAGFVTGGQSVQVGSNGFVIPFGEDSYYTITGLTPGTTASASLHKMGYDTVGPLLKEFDSQVAGQDGTISFGPINLPQSEYYIRADLPLHWNSTQGTETGSISKIFMIDNASTPGGSSLNQGDSLSTSSGSSSHNSSVPGMSSTTTSNHGFAVKQGDGAWMLGVVGGALALSSITVAYRRKSS